MGGWSWEKDGRDWTDAALEGGRLLCLELGLLTDEETLESPAHREGGNVTNLVFFHDALPRKIRRKEMIA